MSAPPPAGYFQIFEMTKMIRVGIATSRMISKMIIFVDLPCCSVERGCDDIRYSSSFDPPTRSRAKSKGHPNRIPGQAEPHLFYRKRDRIVPHRTARTAVGGSHP